MTRDAYSEFDIFTVLVTVDSPTILDANIFLCPSCLFYLQYLRISSGFTDKVIVQCKLLLTSVSYQLLTSYLYPY